MMIALAAPMAVGTITGAPDRVTIGALAFFAFVERDLKYSLITAFVLAVLTCSLLLR